MNENISRSLLAVEALVLLLPLSLLYGLWFSMFPRGALYAFSANPSFVIATLLSGAGLLALWRLLFTAVFQGIAALRALPRGWLVFCTLIAIWTVVALLDMAQTPLLSDSLFMATALRGYGLGIFGAPALLPWLHLVAEARWRAEAV